MSVFLLSEQKLKADFLNDNVDSALVLSAIQTAQDIYLRQTLGDSLFETICELVENNSVVEPYKTLLDDYIIVYLEYLAMSELCVTSTFKLGNIGVAQAYDSNVNTQSIQNVKYLESFYKQKASTYENRLVTYIQQNINYFPEYLDTNAVTTAKESTLQTGLYLGGTSKTKTSKGTSTNKNSLVGAVRYDKQQNLTEQEKQQARENIGVNGGIDVDLENYYTKDETYNKNQVDTKLIPYITTNEVNLRLNSYYDKNTVNNLLDNLPIPESTSELVKDDVYTKNEVDERIANVSSGGSIDLSNYYTKQETYSKQEVNDLVANSGGGGSDTPSNTTIVDIMALTYDEQLQLINYVIDNNRFPDLNTLYTYQGYVLNNLTIYSDWWNEENGERYVVFSLYTHQKSYDIRFITYQWNEGKIYNDIIEKDFNEWLVTNGEINTKLNSYYDKNTVNNLLDNLPIPEATSELVKDDVYTKNEVDDLVANSGGGGSDTPSNTTIVDIMSLSYEEQVELIDFVIDNNRFPDLNILYTYQGYVLNNLPIYSDIWNEENGERYVVFSLYAHPKSYDIRFITYQWNEGKIYNDIIEKDESESLTTKYDVDFKLDTLSNSLVLDLNNYDNDELLFVYYRIIGGQTYTDKPITYRGKFINNVTIEGENVRFWHYAITTDSNNVNSDKTFYVDVELRDAEVGLVSAIYNEIGGCTVIGGNGGGTTDLSNYYTKQETDTAIENAVDGIETFSGDYNDLANKPTIPTDTAQLQKTDVYTKAETFTRQEIVDMINEINYSDINNTPTLSTVATSGNYSDLNNLPTIPTATSQLTLDNVYNKSEIDTQISDLSNQIGSINNLLETI